MTDFDTGIEGLAVVYRKTILLAPGLTRGEVRLSPVYDNDASLVVPVTVKKTALLSSGRYSCKFLNRRFRMDRRTARAPSIRKTCSCGDRFSQGRSNVHQSGN